MTEVQGEATPSAETPASTFKRGMAARQAGRFEEAIALMHQALAAAPTEKWWRLELGATLRLHNRPKEAEPLLQGLLDEHPDFWQAALELSLCLRLQGRLDDSAQLLERAYSFAPEDKFVRLEYATTLRMLNRLDAAEGLLEPLLEQAPELWQAKLGLGICRQKKGALTQALDLFSAALEQVPESRPVRLEYASALKAANRIEEAETLYRELITEPAPPPAALLGLGVCRRLRRDLVESESLLAAAAQAAPRDAAVLLEYATTLREAQRLDDAEATYNRMLEIEPGSWPAQLGLGLCARCRNEYETAIMHFMMAIRNAPQVPEPWFALATEYREAERWSEARATLRILLQNPAKAPAALLHLGYTARAEGRRDKALEIFHEGVEKFPDFPQFMMEVANEAQNAGDFEEAAAWLRRCTQVDELAVQAWRQLGDIAATSMNFEDALAIYRNAAERPDAPPGLFAAIAQVLTDLGRLDEAWQELDAADCRFDHHPDLAQKRIFLLRRAGFRREALNLARKALKAAPAHFSLWCEWFETERFSGNFPAIENCWEKAPPSSRFEHALVQNVRGQIAAQLWDLDTAEAAYREALRLHPTLDGVHISLALVSLLKCDTDNVFKHLKIATDLQAPKKKLQGLPSRPSQTHIGQLVDEFVLDRELLGSLSELQALPAAKRITPLLEMARSQPDHTPTAMMLFLAIRQAGQLNFSPGKGESLIPKTIAQFWADAPPKDVTDLMQSWHANNPYRPYRLFNDASAASFLEERYPAAVLQAYRSVREPASKADLFRLAWLYSEGGCYVDADDRCLDQIDNLLLPPAQFVACQEEYATLGNNFLAVIPRHPILECALQFAVTAINRGDHDMIWLGTGPGLLTRACAYVLANSPQPFDKMLVNLRILSHHELEQCVATHCSAHYKTTNRNWMRSYFSAKNPKIKVVGHGTQIL